MWLPNLNLARCYILVAWTCKNMFKPWLRTYFSTGWQKTKMLLGCRRDLSKCFVVRVISTQIYSFISFYRWETWRHLSRNTSKWKSHHLSNVPKFANPRDFVGKIPGKKPTLPMTDSLDWYVYLLIYHPNQSNGGKCTIYMYMDNMGYCISHGCHGLYQDFWKPYLCFPKPNGWTAKISKRSRCLKRNSINNKPMIFRVQFLGSAYYNWPVEIGKSLVRF